MPFNSFLIDQGRRIYEEQEPSAPVDWEEGEPDFGPPKHGPWFRCRLTEREPRESPATDRGYRYLEGDAELMVGTKDLEGGFLVTPDGTFSGFDSDDKLEIRKKGSTDETEVWEIHTGVEPIRKVRGKLLGFKVGLKRAREADVERSA